LIQHVQPQASIKEDLMTIMKHMLVPALLVLALAFPAAAQQQEEETAMTAADCRSMFQEADSNGDGVLSQQEIAAANLGDTDAGTGLSQFVAECQGS
jgi:hypothetical protein